MFANYCIFVHLASAIAVHCTNLTYPSSLSNILDTAEEVDLSQDLQQWEALSESEKHFISHVLASFAASDGIVLEKLAARFLNDVQIQEVKWLTSFAYLYLKYKNNRVTLLDVD